VAIRLTGAELFHSGVMCDGSRSAWSGWPSARCWKRCRACWCLPRVLRLERRAAGADGGEADQRGGPGKQHGEEREAGIGQGRNRRQVEALAAGQLTLTPVTLWLTPVMLVGTVAGTALNAACRSGSSRRALALHKNTASPLSAPPWSGLPTVRRAQITARRSARVMAPRRSSAALRRTGRSACGHRPDLVDM
jgi:hypothetical protein